MNQFGRVAAYAATISSLMTVVKPKHVGAF